MSILSFFAVYFVIWWITLFAVLPIGMRTQAEADERLARNPGLIASFSRALAEGLSAGQTDAQFNETLAASIQKIYAASIT